MCVASGVALVVGGCVDFKGGPEVRREGPRREGSPRGDGRLGTARRVAALTRDEWDILRMCH